MIASSTTVISNLAYLIGAVVVAVIGGLGVWLHHRQPKSVDANMASFRRGLSVLAPEPRSDTAGPAIRGDSQSRIRAIPGGLTHVRIDRVRTTLTGRETGTRQPPRRLLGSGRAANLARDLAIDLGTANTLVYSRGRGIVLNEPTVIALNSRTQDVLAMGHEAWQMIGRTPGYIVAVRPLRKGAITDFDITQRMIRLLLQRAGVSRFNRPRVIICVPSAITEVERRAVEEAARGAGANGAYLIEQPMAAAIGAGLPIHEPLGNMVVDVGGGTTETAVISLGGIVALEAIRVGSFDIDASIQTYVRREYGIAVGERTAEEIKLAIGSAWPSDDDTVKAEVRGRDLMTGLPKTVILAPEEVRSAIEEQVGAIVDSVVKCLGNSPPELAQDLISQGINLVGGGGMLAGLDRRLEAETSIPVNLVDAPLECVVLGAGKCLEELDAVKDLFMK